MLRIRQQSNLYNLSYRKRTFHPSPRYHFWPLSPNKCRDRHRWGVSASNDLGELYQCAKLLNRCARSPTLLFPFGIGPHQPRLCAAYGGVSNVQGLRPCTDLSAHLTLPYAKKQPPSSARTAPPPQQSSLWEYCRPRSETLHIVNLTISGSSRGWWGVGVVHKKQGRRSCTSATKKANKAATVGFTPPHPTQKSSLGGCFFAAEREGVFLRYAPKALRDNEPPGSRPSLPYAKKQPRWAAFCCGKRGIRTPGGVTLVGFQDRCNRPLCHLSEWEYPRS